MRAKNSESMLPSLSSSFASFAPPFSFRPKGHISQNDCLTVCEKGYRTRTLTRERDLLGVGRVKKLRAAADPGNEVRNTGQHTHKTYTNHSTPYARTPLEQTRNGSNLAKFRSARNQTNPQSFSSSLVFLESRTSNGSHQADMQLTSCRVTPQRPIPSTSSVLHMPPIVADTEEVQAQRGEEDEFSYLVT